MAQTNQRLQIGKDLRKNIFVTQINEREEDEQDTEIPVVRDSGSHLLETGHNTLQKTLVLKREAELAKVDRDLLAKRHEFKARMDRCTARRIELQRKQQSGKDQVTKFDQFIRENEAKRRRAIAKFQEESRLNDIKSKEEEVLRIALKDVKNTHKLMTQRVQQYKKYEDYLHKVIDILPPEYIKADDNPLSGLMMRHYTLSGTHGELLATMNGRLDELKKHKEELHRMREGHDREVLSMNSKLSELHYKREKLSEKAQRIDQQLTFKYGDMRNQIEEFGLILRAISNITEKCIKSFDPIAEDLTSNEKLEKIEYTESLEIIEEYLSDLQHIVRTVERDMGDSRMKVTKFD